MHVDAPEDAGGSSDFRLGMRETAEHILALSSDLDDFRRQTEESAARFEEARVAEEVAFETEGRQLDDRARRDDEEAKAAWRDRQKLLEILREHRHERLLRATGAIRGRLTKECDWERDRSGDETAKVIERHTAEGARRRVPLERRARLWEGLLPRVRERAAGTEAAIRAFATRHGVTPGETARWSETAQSNADPESLAEEGEQVFADVRARAADAAQWWGNSLARFGPLVAWYLALLIVGAGAAGFAILRAAPAAALGGIAAGTLLVAWMIFMTSRSRRRRYEALAHELLKRTRQTKQRFEDHADASLKHLDALHISLAEKQAAKERRSETRIRQASAERSAPARRRLKRLEKREERASKRMYARHEHGLETLEAEEKAAHRARRESCEAAAAALAEKHAECLRALETERSEETRKREERRRRALDDFTRFAGASRGEVDGRNPAWDRIDPARLQLPDDFPPFVPFGRLEVPLAALSGSPEDRARFDLPATLSFPGHGSLLVQHAGGERDPALVLLYDTVLRILTSFPPGKARLTIIDPVGLGQSFSALMHLADQDEALVNGQIWTETLHIQHRLADLTRHIEKVIQKYLRNRYHAIGEYNAVAGELQEPFHFLVIADFPTGFSEVAAEHLGSILNSGPRCGVYTLIAQDTRQEVPSQVDLGRLRHNGPVLTVQGAGFRVEGEGLRLGEFIAEPPPSPGTATTLLGTIGRQSVDADLVEVPFDAVVPEDGKLWSGRTTRGVRVPIGRTGAERLQHLDLGRGTAQHALIAGRTGSGKSTLFHVMITNMSLWFSPDEIEFYLIDFKKGVEFKPFATHRTPHARVVAIESDREFGLSVLRAVDAELARRGDLFRHQGVQDLGAYRKSDGTEVLPRTLVMIDEFQEFFTEDDVVARDAALLLDRFVRQGRAFGIHMVLGSQTLSGIYTLAKSTLGQMGVRISLQCDESDSYLILSEDNGVARLLTRPGEAIYNDMSGLVEGNNPFQVVWLPEEEEAVHLKRVAARAKTTPGEVLRETVVFEGNLPGDLTRNEELAALLAGDGDFADGDDRIWLGDPNAIKGPTEVRFPPASGSNLLIAGQHPDAAFAMMTAAILSLAARRTPDEVRFVILDGGGHDPAFAAYFDDLLDAVPHRVDRYDLRAVPDAVAELAGEVSGDEERDESAPRIYVIAFGLQRLRMLRRGDEYAVSFSDDEPESTGEQFATLLTDGPPVNVHTIVWSDTVTNLMRVLDRRALREFDVRVLFQMSAADSSELIDSSAANLLGLHNALLAVESQGTFEKFRPYAIPDRETMRRLGRG